MEFNLVVVRPFGLYRCGDVVREGDRDQVLAGEDASHVVRVAVLPLAAQSAGVKEA